MQQIIASFKPTISLETLDGHIKSLLKNFDPEDEVIVSAYQYAKFIEVRILKDPKSHLKIVK